MMGDEATLREGAKALYTELSGELIRCTAKMEKVTTHYAYSIFPGWVLVDDATLERLTNSLKIAGNALGKCAPGSVTYDRLIAGQIQWGGFGGYRDTALSVRASIGAIEDELSLTQNWVSRFWSEVVETSASDTVDLTKHAVSVGFDALPWVVAGIIALTVAYLVFTFRGFRTA